MRKNPLNRYSQLLASLFLAVFIVSPLRAPAAGMDERALALEMEKHLKQEILDFWLRQMDPWGGFHQWQDRKGIPDPERTKEKCIWVQCRHVITFSEAAMLYPREKEYRDAAMHGFKFLKERMWDKRYGGWFNLLDKEGNPQKGQDKYSVDQMFAIYALSNYYMLTKDAEAIDLAMKTFHLLEKNARDREYGGYFETLREDCRPYEDVENPLNLRLSWGTATPIGCKGLGLHIHLMLAFAKLYQASKDKIVRERVEEIMNILLTKALVRDGELGCHYIFTRDWQPLPYAVSYGHELELAWYLLESARLIGVRDLSHYLRIARNLVDRALTYARDKKHGGFYDRGTLWGTIWDRYKIWWVQSEVLNALAEMHRYFGKEKLEYFQLLREQWDYILKVFHDPEYGEWFTTVSPENKVVNDMKGPRGKASYHTGRALIHTIQILREICSKK